MNYSSRIAGFNRKKKILGFVMSQSIARGLLRHYTTLRWFASCAARTRTWVGAVTQDIPYTTRKKTIFTAIICVYRIFYGLQHQCHTKTAQNRTSPQHLTQFTPPAVAGKKNAPPFCLRSLGQDSNACSLLWIKHATSRDVVANR